MNFLADLNYGGFMTSLLIIFGLVLTRFFLIKLIRGKSEILDKSQRRWINRINNTVFVITIFALVLIWAPQIHTFALSLTAVAVAVVITTKELLMCLTGGFLVTVTKPFNIGQWVRVDSISGEVMKITALGTVLQEIDTEGRTYQFTGRTVQIPNSRFLTSPAENYNFHKDYVYHDTVITLQYNDMDPAEVMPKLEELAGQYFAPFKDAAIAFNRKVERRSLVDFADPNPQLFLHTSELGHHVFTVRLFLPVGEAAKVATMLTKDVLSYVHQNLEPKE